MFCNLVRQGTVIENDFKENNWLSKAALRLFTLMKISHWSVGREGHHFFDKYHTIEILNEIEKGKKRDLCLFILVVGYYPVMLEMSGTMAWRNVIGANLDSLPYVFYNVSVATYKVTAIIKRNSFVNNIIEVYICQCFKT